MRSTDLAFLYVVFVFVFVFFLTEYFLAWQFKQGEVFFCLLRSHGWGRRAACYAFLYVVMVFVLYFCLCLYLYLYSYVNFLVFYLTDYFLAWLARYSFVS